MNKIKFITLITILGISVIVCSKESNGEKYTQLFGFHLNKSTLTDVQTKLGEVPVISDGDASESSHRINYYFKKDNCYITFDSGEMGGGIYITSFTLSIGKPHEKYLVKDSVNLSNDDLGGLRIGMTIDDIKSLFGKNIKLENNVFKFIYESKRPMTVEEKKYFQKKGTDISVNPYYDIFIVISCNFIKDKTSQIQITRTESY